MYNISNDLTRIPFNPHFESEFETIKKLIPSNSYSISANTHEVVVMYGNSTIEKRNLGAKLFIDLNLYSNEVRILYKERNKIETGDAAESMAVEIQRVIQVYRK